MKSFDCFKIIQKKRIYKTSFNLIPETATKWKIEHVEEKRYTFKKQWHREQIESGEGGGLDLQAKENKVLVTLPKKWGGG